MIRILEKKGIGGNAKGTVCLVFIVIALFFLCVLLVAVIPMGSHSASGFQPETASMPEAESIPEVPAEPKVEYILDPNATFIVLPQQVAAKVGDTFTIQVSVTNVTNMYAWQVQIFFDNTILQCTDVSVPLDYVFSNAYTVTDALTEYNSTEFSNPLLLIIQNDNGRIAVGDSLLGPDAPTFNGSGSLCQIKFRATSSGSSDLALSVDSTRAGTFYCDLRCKAITTALFNGNVVVSSED